MPAPICKQSSPFPRTAQLSTTPPPRLLFLSDFRRCRPDPAPMNNNRIIGIVSFGNDHHLISFTGNSSLSDLLDQLHDRWPELVKERTLLKLSTPGSDGDSIILKRDIDVRNMHHLHLSMQAPHAKLEAALMPVPVQQVSLQPQEPIMEHTPAANTPRHSR
jgi:hypothetical protein